MPIFSSLRFFNRPESQTQDSGLKFTPRGLGFRDLHPEKKSTPTGFEIANLGSHSKHITQRPLKSTLILYTKNYSLIMFLVHVPFPCPFLLFAFLMCCMILLTSFGGKGSHMR